MISLFDSAYRLASACILLSGSPFDTQMQLTLGATEAFLQYIVIEIQDIRERCRPY